jgi:hypothetical protein
MTTNPAAEASHLVTRILHLPITSDADVFGTVARATERVVVALPEPRREHTGGLEAFVLGAIEHELGRRGAAPLGWQHDECLEAKLADQLYRTRLLGAGGLALRFSRLDAIADTSGQLNGDDSDTLRQLLALAEREPLQLYLPEPVAALLVVGEPRRLSDWLTAGSRAGSVATIEYEPSPTSDEAQSPTKPGPDLWGPPLVEAFVASNASSESAEDSLSQATSGVTFADHPIAPGDDSEPGAKAAAETSHGLPPSSQGAQQTQRCVAWMAQLQNMSGPKVHGSVERAFLTAYLPLSREVATGRAPRETQAVVEKWAEGFAHSYATAFKSLNLRAKRPKMVRDVVDVGVRWLGQHRARQCQLLLVSGMRFDLGQRLNEEIERRLPGRVACADQTILWAALPSNGESQHVGDAPARSARPAVRMSSDPTTPSGSAIESLRIGARELFRLDQISSDLAKPGEAEAVRLQRLATTLADHVVPWIGEQPPETLIVIFGDHGFHWQTTETGTSPAQRGGALPEQVLVPASAWLVGEARASKARVAPGVH